MTQPRGLPATFGLERPMLARKPVDLGDYLDEPTPTPPEAPVHAAEPPARPKPVRPPAKREAGRSVSLPASARSRYERLGPPRKQINMRPETLDRARDLLWLVQEYGPQPDAKASEMFEALVDLLWDARQLLDLSDVPLRGKWGEASAREFPQHLRAAFGRAVVKKLADSPRLADAA